MGHGISCLSLFLYGIGGDFHALKGSIIVPGVSNIMIPPIIDSFFVHISQYLYMNLGPKVLHSEVVEMSALTTSTTWSPTWPTSPPRQELRPTHISRPTWPLKDSQLETGTFLLIRTTRAIIFSLIMSPTTCPASPLSLTTTCLEVTRATSSTET